METTTLSPIRALDLLADDGAILTGLGCGDPLESLMDAVIELADGTRIPVDEETTEAMLASRRLKLVQRRKAEIRLRFRFNHEHDERLEQRARDAKVFGDRVLMSDDPRVPVGCVLVRDLLPYLPITISALHRQVGKNLKPGPRVRMGVGPPRRTIQLDRATRRYIMNTWGVEV